MGIAYDSWPVRCSGCNLDFSVIDPTDGKLVVCPFCKKVVRLREVTSWIGDPVAPSEERVDTKGKRKGRKSCRSS